MALQKSLFQISEICSLKGIEEAIICPGSRNAGLIMAFSRNPNINCISLSDERSAAFVAMGLAQITEKTTVLVCTSGSAALNFAPAISEAFFQEIPMLVLTADRPQEWINQYDGQTIFQNEIYGKHVKKSYTLPADLSHNDAQWYLERIVNEAIDLCQIEPKGPVHLNIQIREPFYPEENEIYVFEGRSRVIKNAKVGKTIDLATWAELLDIWESSENKVIAVGQNHGNLNEVLKGFSETENTVILADVISNVGIEHSIKLHDVFLTENWPNKQPIDLLITCGKSFISKKLKQFIRQNKPRHHWHIQENNEIFDVFQSISHKIAVSPIYFLNELLDTLELKKIRSTEDEDFNEFHNYWHSANEKSEQDLISFLKNISFGEFKAMATIFREIPKNAHVHLGNSMPVRYANIIQHYLKIEGKVFANRGTSGIDGILSTAIGQCYGTEKPIFCFIGDVSFFYDINAFWNNNFPQNLKIVMFNNGGGNIFRIIDGPSKQEELEDFFVTHQHNSAEFLANNYKIKYWKVENEAELENILFEFISFPKSAVLEVMSDGLKDAEIFKKFRAMK